MVFVYMLILFQQQVSSLLILMSKTDRTVHRMCSVTCRNSTGSEKRYDQTDADFSILIGQMLSNFLYELWLKTGVF